LKKGIRTPFQIFSWRPGGGRAGEVVHFVWRIPPVSSDRDETKGFAIQAVCLGNIKTYHSRVKKALFLATVVRPSFINSKAAAIAMFKHLTGDILPRDRCKGKEAAIAMAELALATQDFDLIQDIHILNGRPKNISFDVF
jgi:hypothetical protein